MEGSQATQGLEKRHLTTEDLAKRYGVPRQTIYVWRLNGHGPRAMRIGKYLRYRLEDVMEWEESRLDAQVSA